MLKNRKEDKKTAFQILILNLISIIVGSVGISIFSKLISNKEISILLLLLTVSVLVVAISIGITIAFIAFKIKEKRPFKELFKLTFDSKSDIFKMSEGIMGADIIIIVLSILAILIC